MKKLYEKSEITFAILWIVIYTVVTGTLKSKFGFDSLWPMLFLIVLSAALLLFVKRNGLMEKYGLSCWTKNSRAMLWLIPLWIVSCINLSGGLTLNGSVRGISPFYTTQPLTENGPTYPFNLSASGYFLLDDNRESGSDSRAFGEVRRWELLGKVVYVFRRRGI